MSTLYEKRGRRYVPVREDSYPDHLPAGSYLLLIRPGMRSITRLIGEDHAGFLAAAHAARDEMARRISEATRPEPTRAVRGKLRKAWEAYKAIAGDELLMLQVPSAYDLAQAGIDAVAEEYDRQQGKAAFGAVLAPGEGEG